MKQELKNAFDQLYLLIEVDKEKRWIQTTWKGYLSEVNIKQGALAVTEAVRSSGFNCILNNMQEVLGPIRSTEWAAVEWAPQVAGAGLKYMALVNAPDAIAVSDVSSFHTQQVYFHSKVFTSLEAGKEWLRQHCQRKLTVSDMYTS